MAFLGLAVPFLTTEAVAGLSASTMGILSTVGSVATSALTFVGAATLIDEVSKSMAGSNKTKKTYINVDDLSDVDLKQLGSQINNTPKVAYNPSESLNDLRLRTFLP